MLIRRSHEDGSADVRRIEIVFLVAGPRPSRHARQWRLLRTRQPPEDERDHDQRDQRSPQYGRTPETAQITHAAPRLLTAKRVPLRCESYDQHAPISMPATFFSELPLALRVSYNRLRDVIGTI